MTVKTAIHSVSLVNVELGADHVWGFSTELLSWFAFPVEAIQGLQFQVIPDRQLSRVIQSQLTLALRFSNLRQRSLAIVTADNPAWQTIQVESVTTGWLGLAPKEHRWLPLNLIRAVQVRGTAFGCE